MAKLIPFSGASNSGKTTTIKAIKKIYGDIREVDEIIRRYNEPIDIDAIRSNPLKYLDFQIKINKQKIQEELEIYEKFYHSDEIILIDRSIIDSMFYCSFYLDKSSFNQDEVIKYCNMLEALVDHTKKNIYYKVLLFEPIKDIDLENGLRTSNLKYYQDYEYFFIKNITYGCFDEEKIIEVQTSQINKLIDNIYIL